MFEYKYFPVYAPEVDAGTGEASDQGAVVNEHTHDGPGSGRSELRKQLEKSVADLQRPEPKKAKVKPQRSSQAEEMRGATTETTEQTEAQETEQPEEPEVTAVGSPPEGWAKEAKAEWESLPPSVQAAVVKREADTARGVAELKKKYEDIDNAIAPRLEAIRRHGHTPAAAVNQLFAWWEALAGNPDQAFPALAQSLNYDLRKILAPYIQEIQGQAQPQQTQQQEQTQPAYDPDVIKRLIEEAVNPIQQQYQGLLSSFQQSNQAKTQEILNTWSKDKPYFEEVRERMAYLIASGAVPPLPNGSADLDRAYDEAMWGIPTVRQKALADQQRSALEAKKAKQDAERRAELEQAERARRASGSLSPTAPGVPGSVAKGTQKNKSVRETLQEAIAQYRE